MLQPVAQPSGRTSAQNHAGLHKHLVHNRERIKSHHNHAPRYPHLWWTGLLKARRLVHGHRNCHWYPKQRELHMPGLRPNHMASPTHSSMRPTKQESAGMKSSCILRLKLCNANIHTCTSHFMEIQQKDNETLAMYIHHFKTAAKQCAFDNDTVAIHIFVKWLWDAPTIAAKIYEKDPQTWAEVIRLVEKLSAVHTN